MKELISILNEANHNYYVLDNPKITDQEYDKYLRELINLEEKYPELEDVISYIVDNRGPILFNMNPNLDSDAAYDSHTIEFKYEFFIDDERVLEEILHEDQV